MTLCYTTRTFVPIPRYCAATVVIYSLAYAVLAFLLALNLAQVLAPVWIDCFLLLFLESYCIQDEDEK